jgi:hypothetical protein
LKTTPQFSDNKLGKKFSSYIRINMVFYPISFHPNNVIQTNHKVISKRNISGSHSTVAENSGLLGYKSVSSDERFSALSKIMAPSPSTANWFKKKCLML